MNDKERLADKAEKLARNTIEAAFARGKVWVLLCGDKREIAAATESFEDIPSEDEILDQALRRNRAPFQFSQAMRTD